MLAGKVILLIAGVIHFLIGTYYLITVFRLLSFYKEFNAQGPNQLFAYSLPVLFFIFSLGSLFFWDYLRKSQKGGKRVPGDLVISLLFFVAPFILLVLILGFLI